MTGSGLPSEWAWSTLGKIGNYYNGRGFKASDWRDSGRPIIRIQNLTSPDKPYNHFEGEAEEKHVVREGDLLVSWAATLDVFRWHGPEAVLNQHIFKVQSFIDPDFHYFLLKGALEDLRAQTHGAGIVHITRSRFEDTPVPLPPLEEQRRIVVAIESAYRSIDDGLNDVRRALEDAISFRHSALHQAVASENPGWSWVTVKDAGAVQLGRQRSPKYHHGENMHSYLRVANVFEDRIDVTDVMEMVFDENDFAKYELKSGDILLNEGQSAELVGRPAMFRDELPGACFTNSLIRFRANPDVDGEFALLYFLSCLHTGRFRREASVTVNIAHLSATRFKNIEFPMPPLDEQKKIVTRFRATRSAIDAIVDETRQALGEGERLKRSVLQAALTGRLTTRSELDGTVEALLTQIAETKSAAKPKRKRNAPATAAKS